MRFAKYRLVKSVAVAAAMFAAGFGAGTWRTRSVEAQNRFGQPKTVLHFVVYKFRDNVSNYDREKAINGIKDMAGKIPGIKNVWLKAARMEPRDFDAVIVIEFVNREAADRYAESPIHDAWSRELQRVRLTSISPQVTNP